MHEKINFICICLALMFLPVAMPIDSYATDSPGGNIAALDTQSFIVLKEFAGEIKLYLCTIHNGRIFIKDSSSIPYMTMEHRDLDNFTGKEEPQKKEESPIIKIVP
jgi:hypothetical protein